MEKINTGTPILNKFLDGGYDPDILTTLYGPGGSGKTNLCLICALETAKTKKVMYIDTEGVSSERIKQLCPETRILEKLIIFRPTSFEDQKSVFAKLKNIINDSVGLIVIDTIAMLYRLEIGKTDDVYSVNKELGVQLAFLSEIARTKLVPTLIANQVYADFENKYNVNMVGGDLLKYSSKCLLELQKGRNNIRSITIRKHRSLPEEKRTYFEITSTGLAEVEEDSEV